MKKNVFPIFENCKPLKKAVTIPGGFSLEIDLKNAFHLGYIDSHGLQPPLGQNPLFYRYQALIDKSCTDFRFIDGGFGAHKESKIRISNELGRCLALGVLNEYYGYTWFPSIDSLLKTPENGWSAVRKSEGNSPDWLVGNRQDFAVAEAKGTHSKISVSSATTNKWRTQVKNIIVKKNGKAKSLKTWIIASRLVSISKMNERPEMLIEDPPLDGIPVNEGEVESLAVWIARAHTVRNLERLGQYRLILRINEGSMAKQTVLVWQCIHPKLERFRFIGKPVSIEQLGELRIPFWEDFLFHITHRRMERLSFLFQSIYPGGFFDGIELEVVRSLSSNNIPDTILAADFNLEQYDFISFLSDGSLIAPMNLMRPVDVKTI